jgi:5-methylcytosine-specific restriction endonuclease McrA
MMPRPPSPYDGGRWRILRQRVLERDGHLCQIGGPGCQRLASEADHIIPVNAGGAVYDEANLRAACGHCNRAREFQGRKRARRRPAREWPRAKPSDAASGSPSEGGDGVVIE